MRKHLLQSGILVMLIIIHHNVWAQQKAGLRATANVTYNGNSSGTFDPHDSGRCYYPNIATDTPNQAYSFAFKKGSWMPLYFDSTIYNAGGLITLDNRYLWNDTSATYDQIQRTIYTYGSGNITTNTRLENWNNSTASWGPSLNFIDSFSTGSHRESSIVQTWNATSNAWLNSTRTTYMANAQGNDTQSIFQNWIAASGTWQNSTLYRYAYDASGMNRLQTDNLVWNTATAIWDNYGRGIYTLDTANKILQIFRLVWNTNKFDTSGRTIFGYDTAGNKILAVIQTWQKASGAFVNSQKEVSVYNQYHQILTDSLLHWVSGAWVINNGTYYSNYYYEAFGAVPTGINHSANAIAPTISIYPIPAWDEVQIKLSWSIPQALTATITDMQGHIYQALSGPSAKDFSTTLSLKELPAGNYFLSIRGSAGGSASQKIVVCH